MLSICIQCQGMGVPHSTRPIESSLDGGTLSKILIMTKVDRRFNIRCIQSVGTAIVYNDYNTLMVVQDLWKKPQKYGPAIMNRNQENRSKCTILPVHVSIGNGLSRCLGSWFFPWCETQFTTFQGHPDNIPGLYLALEHEFGDGILHHGLNRPA